MVFKNKKAATGFTGVTFTFSPSSDVFGLLPTHKGDFSVNTVESAVTQSKLMSISHEASQLVLEMIPDSVDVVVEWYGYPITFTLSVEKTNTLLADMGVYNYSGTPKTLPGYVTSYATDRDGNYYDWEVSGRVLMLDEEDEILDTVLESAYDILMSNKELENCLIEYLFEREHMGNSLNADESGQRKRVIDYLNTGSRYNTCDGIGFAYALTLFMDLIKSPGKYLFTIVNAVQLSDSDVLLSGSTPHRTTIAGAEQLATLLKQKAQGVLSGIRVIR